MGDPILILHGWGRLGGEFLIETKKLLEKEGERVFNPDLPGLGKNILKKEELYFDDYIDFVKKFIKKNKLKKVILIGHSFGGRIAIAFTARYPELVSKLILVSASGIPHALSIQKTLVQFFAKKTKLLFTTLPFLKFLYKPLRKFLYISIGEMDYFKAGNLQKTFQNIYRVSIVEDLPKISVPTCIIWGENDTFTPLSDGQLMHNKIKNSKFIIVKNEGHKFPYENPKSFAEKVLTFIR